MAIGKTTQNECEAVVSAYAKTFDNLDHVSHLAVMFDSRFADLMRVAIARGLPLTRAEVEQVFGDHGWFW